MADPGSTAAADTIVNGVHVLLVRVYYEDTDAAGVVYHANYLKFAERARTEFLRDLGIDHIAVLAAVDAAFVVLNLSAEFVKPARLDDRLEVHSRLTEVKGASIRTEQIVRRQGDDLVRMNLRLACMTGSGRPVRLPKVVHQPLENMCNSNGRT